MVLHPKRKNVDKKYKSINVIRYCQIVGLGDIPPTISRCCRNSVGEKPRTLGQIFISIRS